MTDETTGVDKSSPPKTETKTETTVGFGHYKLRAGFILTQRISDRDRFLERLDMLTLHEGRGDRVLTRPEIAEYKRSDRAV